MPALCSRRAGGEAGIPGSLGLRTFKLTLAYDGTRFVGWQRQADGESVQGLLETALARFEGGPVTVHGAGRTDAGVHALGQVASVTLACGHDAATLARGLNARLPRDVRVLSTVEASPDFHARFSARSKFYRYLIRSAPLANPFEGDYVWHVPEPLDVARMESAAGSLCGTHDFAAFQSAGADRSSRLDRPEVGIISQVFPGQDGSPREAGQRDAVASEADPLFHARGLRRSLASTRRTLTRSEIVRYTGSRLHGDDGANEGILLAYEVRGDGFLRHMVRAIVGTLVDVGRGWREPDSVGALMRGGTRAQAGPTAPAHGLYLVCVDYD